MPPYISMAPYPLYICMFPLYHMFPCVKGLGGHLYTPYVLGSFWGHQYICQAFLCLSVHPFASQFISHTSCSTSLWIFTGLDAYGCLLCFILLFLSLQCFHYASSFYSCGYDYSSSSDCCVLWYIISPLSGYHGTLLDGASSNIRSA